MSKTLTLCGVRLDALSRREAQQKVSDALPRPTWIVTPNSKMLDACRRDPALATLLNRADLRLPDGIGVQWVARRHGAPLPERIRGIEFGEELLRLAAARGLRVFLLGGREGVAPAAAERLRRRYPNLTVCGTHDGYFQAYGEQNRRLLSLLNTLQPQVLLVCLGFPRQERWVSENLAHLPSLSIVACLGGSLDVWAGRIKQAPAPWRALGLEWAWRLALQPRRLADLPALVRFAVKG